MQALWLGWVLLVVAAGVGLAGPLTGSAAAQSAAPPRLALVVGNSAYKDAPLRNAANDARAIAATLQEAGFAVQVLTDADHRTMAAALRSFGDRLRQGGGMGVFYFAGHGMQIKGRNYLVPVGADIQREDEVAYNALDAQAVLDKMEAAGNGANLMILDACRNNPFARSFRSSAQGLAQMDAPVGSLVAFATAPGSVASDGQADNGLYTRHLLKAMRERGAKVEDIFKKVRSAVRRDSAGQQIPWEATSLESDLYFFAPAQRPAVAAPAATPKPKPARQGAGFAVGDRWNFQVIDRSRGEVIRNYTRRVRGVQADGTWFGSAGDRYDELGRLTAYIAANGSARSAKPHYPRWWPELKVGQSKPFRYESTTVRADGRASHTRIEGEARFVAVEAVRVPAGEFLASRYEFKGASKAVNTPGSGTLSVTVWYMPEIHSVIALEFENTWNGKPESREREELTSYTLAASGGR